MPLAEEQTLKKATRHTDRHVELLSASRPVFLENLFLVWTSVEAFLNSQGIPGANPFIYQKRLAVNLIRTSLMMSKYMKSGL
jgi:hypothetical protein